jgi:TetR/AcrR family transcriptional regulator
MNTRPFDKRSLILDAAQKRFAHYGPSKVTMDEIAGDLGMSKAALYYYFPAKEDVYREVITREQQEFIDRMQAVLSKDLLAAKKLQDYFLHQLDHFNELVNLKLLGREAPQGAKPVIGDLFKRFGRAELKQISAIIRQGKESGEMAVESIEKTAELIVHLLQGLRLLFAKRIHDPTFETEASRSMAADVKLLSRMLLSGLLKKPARRPLTTINKNHL